MRRAYLSELRKDAILEVWDLLQRLSDKFRLVFNILFLTGTASMTKSTSDKSSILVVVVILPLVVSASSLVILCLLTSLSKSLSTKYSII